MGSSLARGPPPTKLTLILMQRRLRIDALAIGERAPRLDDRRSSMRGSRGLGHAATVPAGFVRRRFDRRGRKRLRCVGE